MGEQYLNMKEANRLRAIQDTLSGRRTIADAAQVLGLSERQVKRLKKGVQNQGPGFLAHGNRGRKPANAIPTDVRRLVVEMATGDYRDTSCQHMSELLAEHNYIEISAKSVARILRKAQVQLRFAKKQPHKRRTRDRKARMGMLAQCDASTHDWLEGRGPTLALHGSIDDATSTVLALVFRPTEDLRGYHLMLEQVLNDYGIPDGLYSDRHSIFFSPKKDKLSIEDQLAGKTVALTQFGNALADLGIQHIPARSPQAKGRIERLWGTLQARLITELRIAKISTMEEANAFLPGFIARFNKQFAVKAPEDGSVFSPAPSQENIRRILSIRHPRKASAGSTISYGGQLFQLLDSRGQVIPLRQKATVQVLTALDGTVSAVYCDVVYALKAIPKPEKRVEPPKEKPATPAQPRTQPADHPWKKQQPKPIKRRRSKTEKYFDERPWLSAALGDSAFRDND